MQLTQLVDINEGYLSLMDESTGDIREDIKLPESDIGKEIQSKHDNGDNFMVTIVSAMGEEAAIATKAITK